MNEFIVVVLNTALTGGAPGNSGQLFGVGHLVTAAEPDVIVLTGVFLSQTDAQAAVDALNA
jgi:hypothetical protein